jgi:hypothetical protein
MPLGVPFRLQGYVFAEARVAAGLPSQDRVS